MLPHEGANKNGYLVYLQAKQTKGFESSTSSHDSDFSVGHLSILLQAYFKDSRLVSLILPDV